MKIGLVLFGHLRSFRSAHDSFQQILETLKRSGNVDVFCHTWDIEESVTASWWKEHKPTDPPPATVSEQEIKSFFNPVRYLIEPSRQFDETGYEIQSSIPIAGILSMLHSQYTAFELLREYEKANDFRYAIIIKTRYDLLYEIDPSFNDILNECKAAKTVFIPTSNPYELIDSGSDILAIANRDTMDGYFSFCRNFKEAVLYYMKSGYGQFLPELCMTKYLGKIGIRKIDVNGLRLHILRMNGEKFQVNSDKSFPGNNPLCFYEGTIQTCLKIHPQAQTIQDNLVKLIKKYMTWLDPAANNELLQKYVDLYNGSWIGASSIKRLAAKNRAASVFHPAVMRIFFEEAMRNAKYGQLRKVLLAFILATWSGYGSFFFRVLKKITFDKS
jgi:hypothetical protein